MPIGILAVVLAAAVLHVSWNALVKTAPDGFMATVLIATGGGILCAAALPFLPAIHSVAFWNIAGSVVAQSIYYPMVAAAYRAGDMSLAYPLMRGTAADAGRRGQRAGAGRDLGRRGLDRCRPDLRGDLGHWADGFVPPGWRHLEPGRGAGAAQCGGDRELHVDRRCRREAVG